MSRTWKIAAGVAALAAVAVTVVLVATRGPSRPDMPYVFLTYEVTPDDGDDLATARDKAMTGIRQRLDARALDHAGVWKDSASPARLQVELGGRDVPFDQMIELIERNAVLGVHLVDEGELAHHLWQAAMDEDPPGIFPLVGPPRHGVSTRDEYVWSEDPAALDAWLTTWNAARTPPGDQRIVLERTAEIGPAGRPKWRTYVIETRPIVDGANVVRASVTFDANTGLPEVEVELDRDGTQRFGDATAGAIGRKLAIVLDGRVKSAPVVEQTITGGRISITMGVGDATEQHRQADELVAVLRAGSIPKLRLVERRDVGPAR